MAKGVSMRNRLTSVMDNDHSLDPREGIEYHKVLQSVARTTTGILYDNGFLTESESVKGVAAVYFYDHTASVQAKVLPRRQSRIHT